MEKTQLVESLQKCTKNNNCFKEIENVFIDSLSTYIINFNKLKLNPDYDNFCMRLSNLNISESHDISKACEYNPQENTLTINNEKMKEETNDINYSILKMLTSVYNTELNKVSEGITFDYNGKKYATFINKKIDDKVVEVFFGNNSGLTTLNASDRLYMDLEGIIGFEELFNYYLNARGDLFFSKLSQLSFENDDKCIEFLKMTDELEDQNNILDSKYENEIETVKKNIVRENNINLKKIA